MIYVLFRILFAQRPARAVPVRNCIATVKSSACFPHNILFISPRSKAKDKVDSSETRGKSANPAMNKETPW